MPGQLADKYEKSMLIRRIKLVEIALMTHRSGRAVAEELRGAAVRAVPDGMPVDGLFGPVKYAYLGRRNRGRGADRRQRARRIGHLHRDHPGPDRRRRRSGCRGMAYKHGARSAVSSSSSRSSDTWPAARPPKTRAVDPELKINWNAWQETWHIVISRAKKSVFLSILGISWFWFFGSAMTMQIPAYTLVS